MLISQAKTLLSSADISNAAFKRVDFKSSKLLGLHFDYCNQFLFAVSFVECNLNMASFYRLKLKSTLFDSCSLKEVDFTAADLTQAKFLNSDLADAKFDQTNLQKADLSSAYNYIINPETNRIKKAVFSSSGIAGLLAHYDIVISN